MVETWDGLLEELVDESEFKTSIEEKGFYKSAVSLKIFVKKYNFHSSQNTATYLSLDFWSQQSNVLRKKDMYLLSEELKRNYNEFGTQGYNKTSHSAGLGF